MMKAVLFDMIGTTIKTSAPDYIVDCFKKSFAAVDIQPDESLIKSSRGKDKMIMIKEMLAHKQQPMHLAEPIYQSFKKILKKSLNFFSEMEGASEAIGFLKQKKVLIGIGSGLPEDLFTAVYNHLGWRKYHFDYTGISETLGKGRPDPVMIFDMMQKLNMTDKNEFLKVGDTVADIQEGKNAGVKTAVLLSGTQDETILKNEKPDYSLHSLKDLIQLPLWQ